MWSEKPPFKFKDEVVAKRDVWWTGLSNEREILVFHKGETLIVRTCHFYSRKKGWEVSFYESGEGPRTNHYLDYIFQLKSEYEEEKQLNIFQRIFRKLFKQK